MRKKYDSITDKEKLKVIKMYNSGDTIESINLATNISFAGIWKILKKYNVPKQDRRIFTDEEMIEILKRIKNGEQQNKIADEYNVHESTISINLKRRGLR